MENETDYILENVTKLFKKFGIKSVSMDDIAGELGISKKTLYTHFNDKEELVKKIIYLEFSKKKCLLESFSNINNNAIEEALEVYKMVNGYIKEITPTVEYDLKKYYPQIHKELSAFRTANIQLSVTSNLIKGVSEGLYRNDFDVEIIAKLHIARVDYMLSEEFFTGNEKNSKKAFNELFIYHLRGICSEKGLKFLEEKLDILKKQ